MGPAAAERTALADLLEQLGPEAPTLCEGWNAGRLAAHLVTRDQRLDALPGLVLSPLHPWTERVEQRQLRDSSFPELLLALRTGPPRWSPLRTDSVNVHEYFVHHEDVRRANGAGPREISPELQHALWKRLQHFGAGLIRRSPVGVDITTPEGEEMRLHGGSPSVRLRGAVPELFLYLFGRREVALVSVDGTPAALARFGEVRVGL
jgi:uncharacterized protein (TIGR03085 family)